MSYDENEEVEDGFKMSDTELDDDLLGDLPPEDLDFGLDDEDPERDS